MSVQEQIDRIVTDIAKDNVSGLETLETRKSDSLDFYDVSVWTLKKMLREAFETGLKAGAEFGEKYTKVFRR